MREVIRINIAIVVAVIGIVIFSYLAYRFSINFTFGLIACTLIGVTVFGTTYKLISLLN